MSLLQLQSFSVGRRGRQVLSGIDLTVEKGEVVGLIGPNGAGKTTLLRAALGLIAHQGQSSLAKMPPDARARHVAFLPQGREIAWPISVEDVVALGRLPHSGMGKGQSLSSTTDRDAVEAAITEMGLAAMRNRPVTQLSGGEQARVLIARVLAQGAPLVLADEPVAGLDPAAQIRLMRSFSAIADRGGAVVTSLHDLNLAARHCTRLVLLHQGQVLEDGPPEQVLTAALMARAFGVRVQFTRGADGPEFQVLDTI